MTNIRGVVALNNTYLEVSNLQYAVQSVTSLSRGKAHDTKGSFHVGRWTCHHHRIRRDREQHMEHSPEGEMRFLAFNLLYQNPSAQRKTGYQK